MSLIKKNNEEKIRLLNFDFLLGLFVILALDEHFTYYLNWWYVEFFKEVPALKSVYQIHLPMLGKNLVTDGFNTVLGTIFIPWVSQIYLALSAFKLAAKDQNVLKENLVSRFKIFGLIIAAFVLENFLVAPNFGQAISIYPIIMWMLILALITLVYAYFSTRGIIVLLVLSLLRWISPIDDWSNQFQAFMTSHIHPEFEYDARIEYFLTTGLIGFLLGQIYFNQATNRLKWLSVSMFLGLFLVASFFLFGGSFQANASDSLSNEHELMHSLLGSQYIWGMCLMIISAVAILEIKNIVIKVPVINWVGKNSLTVFGMHRVVFLKIIMPVSMFVGAMVGRTIGASTLEIFIYIFSTIGVSALIYNWKIYRIIFPQKL